MLALGAFCQDYFPCHSGDYWLYELSPSNFDSMVLTGTNKYRNMDVFVKQEYMLNSLHQKIDSGDGLIGNLNLLSYDNFIQPIPKDTNLFIFHYQYPMFKHIYNDGDTWFYPKFTDSLKSIMVGDIIVPAGTFNNCFFVQIDSSSGSGYWFAPDIGLIQTKSGPYIAKLFSYCLSMNISAAQIANHEPIFIISPNPFTPSTSISYFLPETQKGLLSIYSSDGSIILKQGVQGRGTFLWNAGKKASGVYVCRLVVGEKVFSRKMMLMR
jgi:hypothetical protein